MPSVTITFRGMAAWLAHKKRQHRDFMPAAKRGLLSGAMRCLPILQQATREADAVNTGRYLRSWKARPTPDGAIILNDSPYSAIIELGRRPNAPMPPLQVIARWLQRRAGMSRREAQAAAFSVARAIAKRGIRGKRILSNKRPQLVSIVFQEAQLEISKALRGGR